MPPITTAPQNSRATLITWLVVFVMLFVTAAVFAIYYDVQWSKAQLAYDSLTTKMKSTATDADLIQPEFSDLVNSSKRPAGQTAVGVLLNRQKVAARLITGNEKTSPDDLAKNVKDTIAAAEAQLKAKNVSVTLSDNLLQSIRALTDQVATSADAVTRAQADAKAAHEEAIKATQTRDSLLADKDKQIKAAQDDLEKSHAEVASYQKTSEGNVQGIQSNAQAVIQEAYRARDELQKQFTDSMNNSSKLVGIIKGYQKRMDGLRLNPNNALQRADGTILRVQPGTSAGNGTVFISVGRANSVTPGLTFEVYDKFKGLPKLPTVDSADPNSEIELAAGKASIEVIQVLDTQSVCRIVKTAPGQIISTGDLIENLVYDPNTKYNFYVFGNFDIAQSGNANPNDANMIKSLVSRWGGKLQSEVNVDTDFVVMGKEPVVPTLTEDDKNNALAQQRYEEAVKADNDYKAVLARAIDLRIPILNQNKFLYFTGYYDQASR